MQRVRGRAWLGVLAGLLLLTPLVLILVMQRQRVHPVPPGKEHVSPILSAEERQRLPTYQRPCTRAEECESPLGCLPDPRAFQAHCTDSECLTDAQCREGFTCHLLLTRGDGPRVRACVPLGLRQEGQRCLSLPRDQEQACGPGLLCGADWCGRPCEQGDSVRCPAGFFCADVTPGPLCLPTCEGHSCPPGQSCVRFGHEVSACAVVHGANCQVTGCAAHQRCDTLHREDRPGEIWMQCSTPCGKQGQPGCPAGLICEYFSCKKPCDPQVPGTCAEGYRCGQFREGGPWVCRFDRRDASEPSGEVTPAP